MKATSMSTYSDREAARGLRDPLPAIETWPNRFPGCEITISCPEFTSVCPKTGLPDFGTITVRYRPEGKCLELKSLKLYLQAYRNLGIFYENAVNRILGDIIAAAAPREISVTGSFRPRGGLDTVVEARHRAGGPAAEQAR